MKQPQAKERPRIKLTFQFRGLAGIDYGHLFKSFEFQGMVNGGYIIRAQLYDANYGLLNRLMEEGYLKETRENPVAVRFQILAGVNGVYPESATKPQTAIVLGIDVVGGPADIGVIEFMAIDPPSWYLNMGDASGGVFKGRVDQVIKQVIQKYAPQVTAEVGRTVDSEQNKFWMMRQDPKTFLASLMDWSSSVTQRKTNWLVEVDGYNISIKEQAALVSKQRGFYRYISGNNQSTIERLALKADNALSVVQTKLITAGLSSISGQYLDKITDEKEKKVVVKDSNTSNKQIAKTNDDQSFSKPPDAGPIRAGWTEVTAIPEVYSAGELGLRYDEYIDGRPRALWLNMVNSLLRAKFSVLGHGEWSECRGLGIDTVFIKWTSSKNIGGDQFWWTTGAWLVYGFNHVVSSDEWTTDLYCARFDHNADARRIGASE